MIIQDKSIKNQLKNVYFINGTAYAGKSTMVKLLAEKHGGIACEENYHDQLAAGLDKAVFPGLTYTRDLEDWRDFIRRTPEEYAAWVEGNKRECTILELRILEKLAQTGKKIFVDTNIPAEVLRQIAAPGHVLIMLADPDISVKRFFERPDREKQFLYRLLQQEPDPERAMENFRQCLQRVNSREIYDAFLHSGFPVILREEARPIAQTLALAEDLFRLPHGGIGIRIERIHHGTELWDITADYAEKISWPVGKHVAQLLRGNRFDRWEAFFVAYDVQGPYGFCSLLETDYYPENRYSPWISCVWVDEEKRGARVSQKLIQTAEHYAAAQGFSKVYIPSGMTGFYEKYGYTPIDQLVNYGGDTDTIFMKKLF